MKNTAISWTDHTLNFWWGCTKVSPACAHCYAETVAKVFGKRLFGAVPKWGPGKPRRERLTAARKEALALNQEARKCRVIEGQVWIYTGAGQIIGEPETFRIAAAAQHIKSKDRQPEHRREFTRAEWETAPHWRPRVFVNSMSDWLDAEVPIEWLAQLLETLFLCRNLDFQLLTKRPENWAPRMKEVSKLIFLPQEKYDGFTGDFANWFNDWDPSLHDIGPSDSPIPPANIWIGTTVENQEWADKRIPHLLSIPAAVRFLSCEPMLSALDLSGWAEKKAALPSEMPKNWEDYTWPEWISQETRNQIQRFWSSNHHSGPSDWMKDNVAQRTPSIGSRVGILAHRAFASICTPEESTHQGRWVHKWNNIGCVITDEGEVIGASSNQGTLRLSKYRQRDGSYQHQIHWVIAGGESGGQARPSHPDWFRSLRDQCAAANVPFHFKQWGEWISLDNAKHCPGGRLDKKYKGHKFADDTLALRIGTADTGHLLDEVAHQAFPALAQ